MSGREARSLTALLVALMACGSDENLPPASDASADDAGGVASDASAVEPDAGTVARDASVELDAEASHDASADDASAAAAEVYASAVTTFTPGANAGFGQDDMPGVVLGPPRGGGSDTGSLHVVSLGVGGSIVLDLGERGVVDGEGPDLLVFENPFWPGGNASLVFKELGEVSVSQDGTNWFTFSCDTAGSGGAYPGCAGWTPTLVYDPSMEPLDPALTGGDAFDLADLGQASARYVRVRDLSTSGAGNNAGFDLDAVAAIHRGL